MLAISRLKFTLKSIPLLESSYRRLRLFADSLAFPGSADYWRQRYEAGGNSGAGSYNRLAEFKADVLNRFVQEYRVDTVVEFGCGDGNQLKLASYPRYLGFDVSETALALCRSAFRSDPTKSFKLLTELASSDRAELALSLDVVYHLVEDATYERYMRTLFDSASRFVIVYASNRVEQASVPHVRHRKFTDWVERHATEWSLVRRIENAFPFDERNPQNTSFADFYVFERK